MPAWLAWLVLGVAPALAGPRDLLILPDPDDTFSRGDASPVAETPWWTTFDDDGLAAVVEAGIAANPDVAAADARVAQARAVAWQGGSVLLPSLSVEANGSAAPLRTLGFQFGGLPGRDAEPEGLYTVGGADLVAGWQVDLFGRSYLAWRATVNDAAAARADRRAFVIALSTTVGGAYLDVVSAREQERVALEQREIARALLELTELRFDTAGQNGLDVLQQRQQVASADALVATTRMAREIAETQLAILLARDPSKPVEGIADRLPDVPPAPAVGTPADLVARRPDLVAAESRLDAAGQRRVSEALALLPSVRVQAATGRDWIDIDEVKTQDAWSIGGSVSVPLFNGGRGHASVRAARAGEFAAAASYGKAVLAAIGEVEVALAREAAQAERMQAAEAQADAARAAFEEARARYLEGVDPFVTVLLAQNTLRGAELGRVQARRDLLGARLALHAALGGAWADAFGFSADGGTR